MVVSIVEEKFLEIEKLVRSNKNFWNESAFFFTLKNQYIRVYKGEFNKYLESQPNAVINIIIKPDRGKILDVFAQIEFLVNQLIIVQIVGFLSEKVLQIDDILLNVELYSRIKILKDWGILNNKEKDKFIKLKEVRNSFAHKWNEKEIDYKDKPLNENLELFNQDLKDFWNILIDKYIIEEEKNIEKIINKLKTLTEIK